MPRRKKAAARSRPDAAISSTGVGPEKLEAKDVAPETILQAVAIVDEQSAAADITESAPAHPSPPAPDDLAAIDRMLAGAESIEDQRKIFMEILAKKDLDHLEKERRLFWVSEQLHLPRASILARCLHQLGYAGSKEGKPLKYDEVYSRIQTDAPHHLGEAATKHLKPDTVSEPTKESEPPGERRPKRDKTSARAASYFLKDLARRITLLIDQRYFAKEGSRLTNAGERVFNRWPWWSSRDDEAEPRLDSEPVTQRKRTSP